MRVERVLPHTCNGTHHSNVTLFLHFSRWVMNDGWTVKCEWVWLGAYSSCLMRVYMSCTPWSNAVEWANANENVVFPERGYSRTHTLYSGVWTLCPPSNTTQNEYKMSSCSVIIVVMDFWYLYVRVYVYMCIYIYICIYVEVYLYIYVCMCNIYTYMSWVWLSTPRWLTLTSHAGGTSAGAWRTPC